MLIAIHQPEFMPWLGFFHKMAAADCYVIFDHVQFKKRYFENRNRIKRQDKCVWLTLPVKTKCKYSQAINQVEIDNSVNWPRKILESIKHSYSRSPFAAELMPRLETLIIGNQYRMLLDFNLAFIHLFREIMGINTPIVFSSQLDVSQFKGSDLILEICKKVGARGYLCGPSGKDYLKLADFENDGIPITWQQFKHPRYPQLGSEFLPYLSTLDLLFNCGDSALNIINGKDFK